MTDPEGKKDKDQEDRENILENLFKDGSPTPPADSDRSTEEDPEVIPIQEIPIQDSLSEPGSGEAETVDESSGSFLGGTEGETGFEPIEEPTSETFGHAVGDPADPSEDYMVPQAPVNIPRSAFGKAIRHPAITIPVAAALAIVAGRAIDYFLYKSPKKINETQVVGVSLDNEELNKINSQFESLKSDFDGYQAHASAREIEAKSQIGNLEKDLKALEESREGSAVVSKEEIEAIKEQIKEGEIDRIGYLEIFKMFEDELKKIKKAKTATPGITPKETPEPVKPVVPKESDPKTEDLTNKITDDNLIIKHALQGRLQQYEDLMKKITNDEVITKRELAAVTEAYRAVSRLIEKNHVFYGGLPRNSETIKTLEVITEKYIGCAEKIVLANEKVKHNEKYNNIELRINIDALKDGADESNSTGWMDLKISLLALSKLDREAYFTSLTNFGSAVPALRKGEEAEKLIYKLLERAKILKSGHELTAENLNGYEIKGVAIRMTSPSGAELNAKDLKYESFEKETRGD